MVGTIEINGKKFPIELTNEQESIIKKSVFTHYTDIKTFQDALDFVGETREQFNHRTQFDDDKEKADKEKAVIAKAIRMGKPLGTKCGDRWYYPVFNSARSGSGFSVRDYDCAASVTTVGSRHCVNTQEEAIYFGEQFIDVHNRSING